MNMKSIQLAPVDTFICLRSTTPLILAVLDYFFLEGFTAGEEFREFDWHRYGSCDVREYRFKFFCAGVLMIVVWYVVSIFEIIYVKHLVSSIAMTTWGQTYYQNICPCLFC